MTLDSDVAEAGEQPAGDDAPAARTRPASAPKRRTRKSPARKPVRRALILAHRWLSLVLGLVLVVICTSGALVVYEPEIDRATHAEQFHATDSPNPVTFQQAIDAVHRADPGFAPAYVSEKGGVYILNSSDSSGGAYFVDAGTGRVNGRANLQHGPMGFLTNLHDCGLTCEGYTGYAAWLNRPSPVAGTTAFAGMTWGAVILALTGALLVFLAVSGVVIWFPGLAKWRHGFRVRLGKGRFARDYDLHNVIGIVAAVPLLIWGLTGMNFEIPTLSHLWYSATGGVDPGDDQYSMDGDGTGPAITLDDAIGVAQARYPGARITWIGLPSEGSEYYSVDVLDGDTDLWRGSATYHGNRSIGVDAHDPTIVKVFSGPPKTVSNTIIDQWAQPTLHYGQSVNGWWRALWFLFGLTPLALMITGLSTWQFRTATKRRRNRAAAQRHAQ
ncbi:PepSY-associated TM helix domain-containing protein [Gordonia sp. FQ]|uniref:PepSY-associated TM helix domain-containing protein n=1 Tax=Gordonia sp. FQ TaxID=3446634 RepID=UPI003F83CE6E